MKIEKCDGNGIKKRIGFEKEKKGIKKTLNCLRVFKN